MLDALPRLGKRSAIHHQDGLAEWSKALASGASPQGRGFEPHSRHLERGNSRQASFGICAVLESKRM